jgi:hypothetical protein
MHFSAELPNKKLDLTGGFALLTHPQLNFAFGAPRAVDMNGDIFARRSTD